jgi:hypothetical protein
MVQPSTRPACKRTQSRSRGNSRDQELME